ncbi:hypothetical protein PI125_g23377 [Phytophthora idaei]|nr:hypothetical protein PI125_g23377 [Phytophthora idaei]
MAPRNVFADTFTGFVRLESVLSNDSTNGSLSCCSEELRGQDAVEPLMSFAETIRALCKSEQYSQFVCAYYRVTPKEVTGASDIKLLLVNGGRQCLVF